MAESFPDSEDETSGAQMTVGRQLDAWQKTLRIEGSTLAGYKSAIRFWKEAVCDDAGLKVGDRAVRRLKASEVKRAIAGRPDLAGKTVNNYVSVLREAMGMAVTDGMIISNPIEEVPRAKQQQEPPDPFSLEEAEAIIAYMREKYPDQVANYAEAKFFTGVRTSESFAAKHENVDWHHRHLLVKDAIVRGVHKARTKTHVARLVDLNTRALAALRGQKKHTLLKEGGWIFHDPRYDAPWADERAFRRSYWTPTLRTLGIRYRPPYNTRHTYATMLLMSGATPAYAARQLGHSVEMFLKTYAKWIDGGRNDMELARLEAFITSDSSPEIRRRLISAMKMVGWLMGLEPTTTGITILDSTN